MNNDMEPQVEKTPAQGLALPQPQVEQGAGMPYAPEAGVMSPEMAHTAVQPYTPAATPVMSAPVPLPAAPATPVVAPTHDMPIEVENAEDLERELISRAKAIVERTKSDPYTESSELGKAKAEYLRMRYNKHTKLAEESSK